MFLKDLKFKKKTFCFEGHFRLRKTKHVIINEIMTVIIVCIFKVAFNVIKVLKNSSKQTCGFLKGNMYLYLLFTIV